MCPLAAFDHVRLSIFGPRKCISVWKLCVCRMQIDVPTRQKRAQRHHESLAYIKYSAGPNNEPCLHQLKFTRLSPLLFTYGEGAIIGPALSLNRVVIFEIRRDNY